MEKSAGAYLNWRNSGREAWGTLWEKESVNRKAARRIEEESSESARLRHQAELVSSFAELMSIVPEGVGVPLTPEKFIELYKTIPLQLRSSLIDSDELADLYWTGSWQRGSVWRKDDSVNIFFIDERNRVIRDAKFDADLITAAAGFGYVYSDRINNLTEFTGNLFPAERFFEKFFNLDERAMADFNINADILLSLDKPVLQIGLSSGKSGSNYGVIGFESVSVEGYRVTVYPVPTESVNKMLWTLAWSDSDTLFRLKESANDTGTGSKPGAER